jgi:recombination protein RecA
MASSSAKSLDKFLAEFQKSFGQNAVETAAYPQYDTLTTGSIALDKAMGAGGFVRGRITEVWGPPSGGKSSLTLISAGHALQDNPGLRLAYIDVEATFDGEWAEKLGVDLSRVDVIHPQTAEDVADMVKMLTMSGLYVMVILDSIGAMVAMKEFEKNAEDATVGLVAKIVTRMIKISTYYVRQNNLALVIINQLRANIGGYGVDTVAGGGFALDHSLTHKLYVKRGSAPYKVGSGDEARNVGYEMVVKVEKSKVCPEGRVARFGFFTEDTEKYGPVGIDKAQEAFTMGVALDVIQHVGISYVFPDGEKIASSNVDGVKKTAKDNAIDYLRSHPEFQEQIRTLALKSVEAELKFIEDAE